MACIVANVAEPASGVGVGPAGAPRFWSTSTSHWNDILVSTITRTTFWFALVTRMTFWLAL